MEIKLKARVETSSIKTACTGKKYYLLVFERLSTVRIVWRFSVGDVNFKCMAIVYMLGRVSACSFACAACIKCLDFSFLLLCPIVSWFVFHIRLLTLFFSLFFYNFRFTSARHLICTFTLYGKPQCQCIASDCINYD